MGYVPWEEGAPVLGLDEELGVEQVRGRVKGRARDRGVDVVRGGDSVPVSEKRENERGVKEGLSRGGIRTKHERDEEPDDLDGAEAACVIEPREDAIDRVYEREGKGVSAMCSCRVEVG